MKRILFNLILIVLALSAGLSLAQGAPEQINDALADLNQRLGTAYTLNDIFWTWSQQNYPDGSMGCPQGISGYSAEPVVGYQFVFTVDQTEYDYRVSADREILFLCEEHSLAEEDVLPTPAPVVGGESDAPYSNTLCPAPPADISYMHTRLAVDIEGRVEPGLPVRVRMEPNTLAGITGELPGEVEFRVIEGPACDAEGHIWWRLDANGFIGWVAEGRDGDYWLEPLPGDSLAAIPYPAISLENAANLSEVSRLQGNLGSRVTFTPDGRQLVITGAGGSEGVWIYDAANPQLAPRIINGSNLLTEIAFGPQSDLALLGSGNGAVRLWNIAADANLVERVFLLGHDRTVSAVAFSPGGTTIASSGGRAFMRLEDPGNQYGIILWDIDTVSQKAALRGHTDEVTALRFDPTGTALLSGSLDGSLRVWTVETGAVGLVVEMGQPVLDAVYSPDGSIIAAALADGQISLIANTQRFTFPAHSAPVNSLAFTPDGSILVTGGDDGLAHLWDVAGLLDTETTDTPLITLTGHSDSIHDVAVSPNGQIITTLSRDNTARLWAVVVVSVG